MLACLRSTDREGVGTSVEGLQLSNAEKSNVQCKHLPTLLSKWFQVTFHHKAEQCLLLFTRNLTYIPNFYLKLQLLFDQLSNVSCCRHLLLALKSLQSAIHPIRKAWTESARDNGNIHWSWKQSKRRGMVTFSCCHLLK